MTVNTDTRSGMARVNVSDTGDGIAPEYMDGIFEPFNRLGAEATEVEGTGIGLTLTRELVERMNGTIGVASTLGEGSTFWIEIPLAARNGAPMTPLPKPTPLPRRNNGLKRPRGFCGCFMWRTIQPICVCWKK